MRITRSDLDSPVRIESSQGYAADQRCLVISDETACKGVQVLAPPGSRKKIWGKKKSPLRVYVSPSISQTYSVPLSRIKWEIYFYKEVCFILFIEVHSLSLIMFLIGSMRSIQYLLDFFCWDGTIHHLAGSFFFLLTITKSGHLAEIRWSVCITKSKRILCIYHLNFLAQFPVDHLPHLVMSSLVRF